MSKSKNESTQSNNESLKYDPNTLSSHTTTAAKIRYLLGCGMKRGEVAKTLSIRYQWVRNVDITPIKTK